MTDVDVLVVGAGPAGSAAAAWAARSGLDVLLVDAADFPRDKPCGDGLTPRAIAELDGLGMTDWLDLRARNYGLRAAGFGQLLYLPWPGGALPAHGGAVPRTVLDAAIRDVAIAAGAKPMDGKRAIDVQMTGDRVSGVQFRDEHSKDVVDHVSTPHRRRWCTLTVGAHARPRLASRYRLWRRRARLHRFGPRR
jgi:menaquinone-9 beta-reductase